jgi:hypothetical protein
VTLASPTSPGDERKLAPVATAGEPEERAARDGEATCELSVVIPVFNEEANVAPLYKEITGSLRAVTGDYEILFVDDGSRDATLERLRALTREDPRLKVLSLARNYGQSAAIQAGFDFAAGRVVVTLDGDLQNDPADIGRLVETLHGGYDVVTGWRQARKDALLTRRLPSRLANWLIGKVTRITIHDNGCTLKAYRRRVVKKARLYSEMHRFLVPMLALTGSRIAEIPVFHRERRSGSSKYGLSRIWKVLLDLVTVKMLLRFASHPAAWFAVLALPFLVVGAAAAAVGAVVYTAGGSQGELPIVLLSIAALGAFATVHLVLLGMLAEAIVRVGDYRESQSILFAVEGAAEKAA